MAVDVGLAAGGQLAAVRDLGGRGRAGGDLDEFVAQEAEGLDPHLGIRAHQAGVALVDRDAHRDRALGGVRRQGDLLDPADRDAVELHRAAVLEALDVLEVDHVAVHAAEKVVLVADDQDAEDQQHRCDHHQQADPPGGPFTLLHFLSFPDRAAGEEIAQHVVGRSLRLRPRCRGNGNGLRRRRRGVR